MVSKKECWSIPGFQNVNGWTKDYGDYKSFEHFLCFMDMEKATKYIDNLFYDLNSHFERTGESIWQKNYI